MIAELMIHTDAKSVLGNRFLLLRSLVCCPNIRFVSRATVIWPGVSSTPQAEPMQSPFQDLSHWMQERDALFSLWLGRWDGKNPGAARGLERTKPALRTAEIK